MSNVVEMYNYEPGTKGFNDLMKDYHNPKMVSIEVEEDALERLDSFIRWCYTENIMEKNDNWGYDADRVYSIPHTLMSYALPIAKSFGLYPFNQKKLWENTSLLTEWFSAKQKAEINLRKYGNPYGNETTKEEE